MASQRFSGKVPRKKKKEKRQGRQIYRLNPPELAKEEPRGEPDVGPSGSQQGEERCGRDIKRRAFQNVAQAVGAIITQGWDTTRCAENHAKNITGKTEDWVKVSLNTRKRST